MRPATTGAEGSARVGDDDPDDDDPDDDDDVVDDPVGAAAPFCPAAAG